MKPRIHTGCGVAIHGGGFLATKHTHASTKSSMWMAWITHSAELNRWRLVECDHAHMHIRKKSSMCMTLWLHTGGSKHRVGTQGRAHARKKSLIRIKSWLYTAAPGRQRGSDAIWVGFDVDSKIPFWGLMSIKRFVLYFRPVDSWYESSLWRNIWNQNQALPQDWRVAEIYGTSKSCESKRYRRTALLSIKMFKMLKSYFNSLVYQNV